jgi:tetratricopeptide (TPR) repeat protein
MNETSAEAHKVAGNTHFGQGSYEEAIKEYSTAIIQKPDGISYYTNRALAYLKLSRWDECISDCQKAVEIDRSSVKGHYLLGQALTEQQRYKEALSELQRAYELSLDQKVSYTSDILAAILAARRRKWEKNERQRLEQESDLFRYLKTLIDADRDRKLQSFEQQTENVDDADEVNYEHDMRLSQVKSLLRQSDESLKREVPDYFCDKISFNVLVDPVRISGMILVSQFFVLYCAHAVIFRLSRRPESPTNVIPFASISSTLGKLILFRELP